MFTVKMPSAFFPFNNSVRVVLFFVLIICFTLLSVCKKEEDEKQEIYPADVAIAWFNLQLRLTRGTPGFNSIVSNRSFAYLGLTLYESIVPALKKYQSIAPQLNGNLTLPSPQAGKKFYLPSSANAALASISKKLFANTTPALMGAIDSLEVSFAAQFQQKAPAGELQRAVDFGRLIADAIFEWSKTDGGHEAYKNLTSPQYTPPAGPGLWVPTPPLFAQPLHPFWGMNRSFIPNLIAQTAAAPPPVYSEVSSSDFYKAAQEIFTISQSLSREDTIVARFWADLPANYNVPAHAANILSQLIEQKKISLPEAAVLYCKHGIAGNESIIACFNSKYRFNMVRPVTYIRNVLGYATWSPLIPTPPFPEYTSAHAIVSTAMVTVLEEAFGKNFSFTDRSYEQLYGARSYASLEAYATEATISRLYGGIHYRFGAEEGVKQGKKVGQLVNGLRFTR
jgi:hypothetical protein